MINQVILIGRVGKDVDLRHTSGGTATASFSIATTEKFKDKNGKAEERTEWHNIVLWGRIAEIAQQYVSKGDLVFIEGRITTRKWQDKNGNDKYTTEIVGQTLKMLGGGKGEKRQQSAQQPQEDSWSADDDIPF